MDRPAAGEIRVLGGVEIVREDGEAVELPAKERRLLAALAAAHGEARTNDVLVEALWGAAPPRSASKLVQVYVSKLRKVIPPGTRIRFRDSGYALELVDGTLDAARFERLLVEARTDGRDGNPSLVASRLRRALALWRGDAFGELAGEEFARAEARRLEELRLVAHEERIEAELELGRGGELIPELRALADAEPLRERLQGQLMRALYRAGNQAEALDVYVRTRARLVDELGLEPGAELRDVQRRVLQQDASLGAGPPAERAAGALPSPPNSLVGRERELGELRELLARDDVRLLVLTGAGGSGKTRLALEAAREAAGAFANGAVLVELAPVQDPGLLLHAIARALGVERVGREPLEQLVTALRRRETLLLLDNLEHLREGAAPLVELMTRAPGVKLLVTSRAVLHLSGEHVYAVAPLREEAAAALFVERAREAGARFEPDVGSDGAIAALCRRVDGLPLAIELAAGRVRTRTPAELLAALEQRLPLLTGGPRDRPARQQTLRATLEWSVDLLDEAERRDLARLSVFPSRFSLESADAVCDTTVERLGSLVDHNLLVRSVTLHGSRYSMLETIRELAAEHLDASGAGDTIRRRHATRLIAVAEEAHVAEDADEPFHWPVSLAEPDDLRAALDWASEQDVILAFELASAWENYWGPHAPAEGVRRVRRLLDRAEDVDVPPPLRARALRNLAGAAHQERDYDVAQAAYEASLRLFEELGDVRGAASIRMRLAYIARSRGEADRATDLLEQSLRDADGRFPMIEIQGALLRAHSAVAAGRFEDAELLLQRCDELRVRFAWRWYDALVVSLRMWLALGRGQYEEAERRGREALATHLEENHAAASTVGTIAGLAQVALATGRLERAGLLWGAAFEQGEQVLGGHAEQALEEAREERRPAFLDALARGRRLDLQAAAALALADRPA